MTLHTLRPALLLRNARIPNGRVLDGLQPRRPPGGSLPHTRHAHAQRRLRHPIRRPRLRHGNQGRVGSAVGSHSGDKGVKLVGNRDSCFRSNPEVRQSWLHFTPWSFSLPRRAVLSVLTAIQSTRHLVNTTDEGSNPRHCLYDLVSCGLTGR